MNHFNWGCRPCQKSSSRGLTSGLEDALEEEMADEIAMLGIPTPSHNEFDVPLAFLRNCGTWEGTAQRVDRSGQLIDEHLVRIKIKIDGAQYVQTNTVRIDTPREVTAQYYGDFRAGKLVFPLTDEVYTLGGEKAQAFSGIAWAVTDELIVYRGSRTLQGCQRVQPPPNTSTKLCILCSARVLGACGIDR
jgi:hypothetical protein